MYEHFAGAGAEFSKYGQNTLSCLGWFGSHAFPFAVDGRTAAFRNIIGGLVAPRLKSFRRLTLGRRFFRCCGDCVIRENILKKTALMGVGWKSSDAPEQFVLQKISAETKLKNPGGQEAPRDSYQ
jgi:hypothetical protein